MAFVLVLLASPLSAQSNKTTGGATGAQPMTAEKAIELAQHGQCKEALPTLKRTLSGAGAMDTRKHAGIAGLGCALGMDDRDASIELLRQLQRTFPKDPEVLFVVVHAYSDLSTRTAQDLGRFAPQSIPARKLAAEAWEMQGKWDDAQREYESMIAKEPNAPGLHFLLGRSLLSRPDADAKTTERAEQEFLKELEIDPKNAAAEYVLGELASKEENWDEAIARFSQAAKLDANFAEAYLAWGFALVNLKHYQEAIVPLVMAERLTPGNPAVHYALATAFSRTGQKEEADKEFAIHRSLTSAPHATEKPN